MRVEINGREYVPKPTMIDPEATFGASIKKARLASNQTLDEVAAHTGLSKSALWGIENDRQEPRLNTVRLLLMYFGLQFWSVGRFPNDARHEP